MIDLVHRKRTEPRVLTRGHLPCLRIDAAGGLLLDSCSEEAELGM